MIEKKGNFMWAHSHSMRGSTWRWGGKSRVENEALLEPE